jgi:hypothetical protein
MTVEATIKMWETHKKRKELYHPLWEDLARVHLPRRSGFTRAVQEGESLTESIYDGTPMRGARGLGNNVGFFLRPENQDWLFMRVEDERVNASDDAKFWIADTRERLMSEMLNPKARFRQATGEVDVDLVVFGTGILWIGENRELTHLLYRSLHLRDTVIVYNDEGAPVGFFWLWQPTIRQAMNKFDESKFSDGTKEKIRVDKIDEKIRILQAVLPRKGGDPNALLSKNLPFSEEWIEIDEKHVIVESGYHEFPVVAPRWDTTSGEDYGRSPAMVALPDSNTLQAMGETILVSGQRAADPPLMAPNDGSFSAINTFPGGISYYDVQTAATLGQNPFFPLQSGVNLPITRDMQVDTREQVMSAFFKNILNLPIEGPQMTATEVIQRKDEFIREIGPVFGRFESDYTTPTVERTFNILLRAGAFLPVPDSLGGQNVVFEFESPISKIREQVRATAMKLFVQETIEVAAATGDISVMDNIDMDEAIRINAESVSVPNGVLRPRREVEDIRASRAQQQAAEQAMLEAEQAANIGKTVAEADSKSSALEGAVNE